MNENHGLRDLMEDFERLYSTFSDDVALAKHLVSPNPDDTLETKVAIVGFCHKAPVEAWSNQHHRYIMHILTGCDDLGKGERLFCCYGSGYLQGLFHAGEIGSAEFTLGELQLPGFVAFRSGEFHTLFPE